MYRTISRTLLRRHFRQVATISFRAFSFLYYTSLTNFAIGKSWNKPWSNLITILCRTTKLEVLIQVISAIPHCFFNINICFMCFLLLSCVCCRKSILGFVTDFLSLDLIFCLGKICLLSKIFLGVCHYCQSMCLGC